MSSRILRLSTVISRVGLSRSTIYMHGSPPVDSPARLRSALGPSAGAKPRSMPGSTA